MVLAGKRVRAGIVFTLLTAGMLLQNVPRSTAASDSNKEGVAAFVIKNEIKKIQETLHDKGHDPGRVDGAIGQRTRASIRAYQKAENLPITGQVDTRTADRIGVRPELSWGDSQSTRGEVGDSSDGTGGEIKKDKPSAGIRWAKDSGRTSMAPQKAVKAQSAPKNGWGNLEKKLQAVNENTPQ